MFAVARHDHYQQGGHNQLACLSGHMLNSCSPPSGWDGFRVLVGLGLGEDPESRLREMAGDGTDGDGVSLPVVGARVDLGNVLLGPAGLSVVGGDDIAGFDVPSLRSGMLRERPT